MLDRLVNLKYISKEEKNFLLAMKEKCLPLPLEYLKYRYKGNKFSKIRLIFTKFRKSGHL